jgi:hypothetical protein
MREGIAVFFALASLAALGCEGVPDLVFAPTEDASTSSPASTPDATILTADGSSVAPTPDSALASFDDGASADALFDDAQGPTLPLDAAQPPPASDGAPPPVTGCPNNPPGGVTCCGAVACKGDAKDCNCGECAFCASEGFCCPSTHPPPGFCATSLAGCH